MKFIFGLLSFVTVGLFIGSVSQLALLRKLEDSHGNSFWKNDIEAKILRLGYIKPEVLSWSPRIILLHNFLSTEECEYLKAISYNHLQKSTVIDPITGKIGESILRTSSSTFLHSEDIKHPMVQGIEKRISVYAHIPIENAERLQILRYEKNEFFEQHVDFLPNTFIFNNTGQRIATMLLYLSDNFDGGETYFPKGSSGECKCGGNIVKGLSVEPNEGNAILFWSMGLDGRLDYNTIHEACEVLSGTKWTAVKWMERMFGLKRGPLSYKIATIPGRC